MPNSGKMSSTNLTCSAYSTRSRTRQPVVDSSEDPVDTCTMGYVITQPCIGVKDASCIEVCPVDCIHSDDDAPQYYIDPDECIDCGACVDTCPVDAIYPEDEVPAEYVSFVTINADYFMK
jgi:ferredoxin